MGLTCFVSPILGGGDIEAKITVGPFLMVERQDYIACDLEEQLGLSGETLARVVEALEPIPISLRKKSRRCPRCCLWR